MRRDWWTIRDGNEPEFPYPLPVQLHGLALENPKTYQDVADTWFTDDLFGIPGDEDGGNVLLRGAFHDGLFSPLPRVSPSTISVAPRSKR